MKSMNAQPIECPRCNGTAQNTFGGPCKACDGTGYVSGAAKTAAVLTELGKGLLGLAFFGTLTLILIALIIALIVSFI